MSQVRQLEDRIGSAIPSTSYSWAGLDSQLPFYICDPGPAAQVSTRDNAWFRSWPRGEIDVSRRAAASQQQQASTARTRSVSLTLARRRFEEMTVTQVLPSPSPSSPTEHFQSLAPQPHSALQAFAAASQVAAAAGAGASGLGLKREKGGDAMRSERAADDTNADSGPASASNSARPPLNAIASVGKLDLLDEPGPSKPRLSPSPSTSPRRSPAPAGQRSTSTSPHTHPEDIPPCTPRKHRFAHHQQPRPQVLDRDRSSSRGSRSGLPTSRSAGELIAGAGADWMASANAAGGSRPQAIGRGSSGKGKGRLGFDVGSGHDDEEELDSNGQADLANYDNR